MIILCAALRIIDKDIVIPCFRHGYGYDMLYDLGIKVSTNNLEQGFITTGNKFLTRKEAFDVSMNNGQLSQANKWYKQEHNECELYSEDLY